jgi:glycosyltransferase involved in cell wall biosynthesis
VNILYHFRTRGTGSEGIHIAGMVEAFDTLGHHVVLSSPTGSDPRRDGGDPWGTKGKAGAWRLLAHGTPRLAFEALELAYNLPAYRRNAAIVRSERPGLIYERHAFFMWSTATLARKTGIPYVVEVNELVGDERIREQPVLSGIVRRCDAHTLGAADLVVVVSAHLKRRLVERGIDEAKIVVMPNGVTERDVHTRADGAGVRARYGIERARVIGFVGWFLEWHRLDWLVDAFATAFANEPDVYLMLVGSGPSQDDLKARAASQGVGDRLLITGTVPRASVYEHIAAFDVAVVPHSNAYRSPIKLFEYMSQENAVLAPGTEPVRQVLRDMENGCIFTPDDREDLARGMRTLLADGELRRRLGAQARRDVLDHHTWEKNAEAVLRLVAERRQAPAVVGV